MSKERKEKKKSTKIKKEITTKTESPMLRNNELEGIGENHIVPLEPTQTYIYRDFLRTNNILNQSMNILHEQNNLSMLQYEKEKNLENRKEHLDKAAYDARTNALALASVVQAKVQYIKAIKDIKGGK